MVIVAVAGGTGDVGRTILDAIVNSGNHRAFVLSRTATGVTATDDEPQRLVVDYNDADQIKSVLQDNKVEVVVSALLLADEQVAKSQINLIRGAARSGTVVKFIPSEYYIDFHAPIDGIELSFKKFQVECEQELEHHPQLTWTLLRNGLFLDYLAMPFNPKPTNLKPWWIFIDLKHETCVFPGDGTQTIIFTHSTDLAAYIERLISLPASKWPRESLIISNKIKVKELAQLASKVTGREFKVTYDSPEAIQTGHITQLPSNQPVFTNPTFGELFQLVEKEVMLALLSNAFDLHRGTNLADLFPDVRPTTIEEFLREGWSLLLKEAS